MANLKNGNKLFYGDNLDVLRGKIKDETVDLCYIDPPFNSKRNYNQIYNRIGKEDRAQAQAFTDTWIWDEHAIAGYEEIIANDHGRFQAQLIELIKGLNAVLGKESLLAYLVSMSLRITEIQRVLKLSGSFYLHCDPTASHYLKLICDAIFCSQGGNFLNEIIWSYRTGGVGKQWFSRKHDVLFLYSRKTGHHTFHVQHSGEFRTEGMNYDETGRPYKTTKKGRVDSTGERNMIDFMLSLEGSRWRKWVDRACPRSRRRSCGRDGRPVSRLAILVAVLASMLHQFLACCSARAA